MYYSEDVKPEPTVYRNILKATITFRLVVGTIGLHRLQDSWFYQQGRLTEEGVLLVFESEMNCLGVGVSVGLGEFGHWFNTRL